MMRGEVWWADFATGLGGEIRKERPAVIVSNNIANSHLNRVQVVPLTSSVDRVFPGEAYVTMARKKHKAMANQLMTASKLRLRQRIDRLSDEDMIDAERAIQVRLALIK